MESTDRIFSQDKKRISLALLGCLLIHVFLFWLVLNQSWITKEAVDSTVLEIADEALVVPEWVDEIFTIVQTNPDTPENEPDRTKNLSDRKQQNQQMLTLPGQKEGLQSDGDSHESEAIFSGTMNSEKSAQNMNKNKDYDQSLERGKQDLESAMSNQLPTLFSTEKLQFKEQIFPQESNSSQDGMKVDDDIDNKATEKDVTAKTFDLINIPNTRDLQKINQTDLPKTSNIQPPLPRPKLDRNYMPTVKKKSKGVPLRSGSLSIEADDRFKQFVAYHRAMLEIIIKQWYQLAAAVEISAEDRGTKIKVSFTLEPDGKIKELKVVDSNVRSIASLICKDAIQSPAPFRHWSPKMIEELEEAVTLQITFHY